MTDQPSYCLLSALTWGLWLCVFLYVEVASAECDLPVDAEHRNGYRDRDGVCEGTFFDRHSTGDMKLLGYHSGVVRYDLTLTTKDEEKLLPVIITTPVISEKEAAMPFKIVAVSTRPNHYYRMDVELDGQRLADGFTWNSLLAREHVDPLDLAITICEDRSSSKPICFPADVRPASSDIRSNWSPRLLIKPAPQTSEIWVTLSKLSDNRRELIYDEWPIEKASYHSDRIVEFLLEKPLSEGRYELALEADAGGYMELVTAILDIPPHDED